MKGSRGKAHGKKPLHSDRDLGVPAREKTMKAFPRQLGKKRTRAGEKGSLLVVKATVLFQHGKERP